MLGYLAKKALVYGSIWSVSGCLSLCLGSMATGSCSQHIETINKCRIMLKVLVLESTIIM